MDGINQEVSTGTFIRSNIMELSYNTLNCNPSIYAGDQQLYIAKETTTDVPNAVNNDNIVDVYKWFWENFYMLTWTNMLTLQCINANQKKAWCLISVNGLTSVNWKEYNKGIWELYFKKKISSYEKLLMRAKPHTLNSKHLQDIAILMYKLRNDLVPKSLQCMLEGQITGYLWNFKLSNRRQIRFRNIASNIWGQCSGQR